MGRPKDEDISSIASSRNSMKKLQTVLLANYCNKAGK